MARIKYVPNRVIDHNGISDGANVFVYQSGTTTPVQLYLDEALTEPVSNPYPVPTGAPIPVLYHDFAGNVRMRVVAADGSVPLDEDPYDTSVLATDLASPNGAAGVGLDNGTVKDAIKFLTPAMFNIPDNGDEEEDVTVKLLNLAEEAALLDLPIQLAPRVYKTDGTEIQFATSVRGSDGTVIRSTATTAQQHIISLVRPGITLDNVEIDGNVSTDPVAWDSANYNSFTGNRGLKVAADNVVVSNVAVRNVRWAGFLTELCDGVVYINCRAERCRGNFGDGFIAMGSRQVSYINCTAIDFTRIGFVADSYGVEGQYCAQVSYINCYAENGHDGSIDYGGTEYNAGFWNENTGAVTWDNCHTKDTGHRGFVGTAGEPVLNLSIAPYVGRNCTVSEADYGFILEGLDGVPMRGVLENCHVKSSGIEAFTLSSRVYDRVRLIDCGSELSGTQTNRVSVRVGLGEVIIDGFTEKWATVDNTKRDATDNYYGSISHFANAPGRVSIKDWKTVDAADAQVGSVFKFLSAAGPSLDINIERCLVRGVALYADKLTARDVSFERTGVIDIRTRCDIRGGSILDGSGLIYFRSTTRAVSLDGVLLDFKATGSWLGFYNRNSAEAFPKVQLRGCRLEKDFSTGSPTYGVRMNADASVINTLNANHLEFSDGIIVNTGSATSNPPFRLESGTDTAMKLHGRGNLKSPSLSAVVNGAKLAAASSFEDWG